MNTKNSVIASKNWPLNATAAARKNFDGGVTGQSTTSTPWKFDSVSRRNSTAPGSSRIPWNQVRRQTVSTCRRWTGCQFDVDVIVWADERVAVEASWWWWWRPVTMLLLLLQRAVPVTAANWVEVHRLNERRPSGLTGPWQVSATTCITTSSATQKALYNHTSLFTEYRSLHSKHFVRQAVTDKDVVHLLTSLQYIAVNSRRGTNKPNNYSTAECRKRQLPWSWACVLIFNWHSFPVMYAVIASGEFSDVAGEKRKAIRKYYCNASPSGYHVLLRWSDKSSGRKLTILIIWC